MARFDKFVDSMKDGLEKVGDKVIEVKNSEKTRDFIEKAKDTAIHVGVKVTDIAEELGDRAKVAMHNVADKREAQKAQSTSAEAPAEKLKKAAADVVAEAAQEVAETAEAVAEKAEEVSEKAADEAE